MFLFSVSTTLHVSCSNPLIVCDDYPRTGSGLAKYSGGGVEQVFKAELKEGDSIVMGSDGLFDNVYDRDVETTLSVFGGSDEESAIRSGKSGLVLLLCTH